MPSQTPCASFGNGNRNWIGSKAVSPWFGLGAVVSGSCPDGDASSFLSQQRFHVRCHWCFLDHDNHGC